MVHVVNDGGVGWYFVGKCLLSMIDVLVDILLVMVMAMVMVMVCC